MYLCHLQRKFEVLKAPALMTIGFRNVTPCNSAGCDQLLAAASCLWCQQTPATSINLHDASPLQSVEKHSVCVFCNVICCLLFSTFAIICFPSLSIPSFPFWILFFHPCSSLSHFSFYSTFLSTFLFLRPLSLPPLPLHTHVAYWGSYLYQGFVAFSP